MALMANAKSKEKEVALEEELMDNNSAPAVHSSPAINSAPTVRSAPAIHSAPTVHSPIIDSAPAIRSTPAARSAPTIRSAPAVNPPPDDDYIMEDDGSWGNSGRPPGDFELEEDEQAQNDCKTRISSKRPLSSPSPPLMPPPTSRGTFRSHLDHMMNRGSMHAPPSPPSIASSSAGSSSARTILSSHRLTSSAHQQGAHKAQKSSLSNQVQSDIQDMRGQVDSLAEGMQFVYTVKAAQSEYKIAKVNSHRQELEISFQREQAKFECSEAAVVHQRSQEAKSLEIQILEA